MWQAKRQNNNDDMYTKYHSAWLWLNRLDSECQEEFTEKDFDDRLFCQREMNRLLG